MMDMKTFRLMASIFMASIILMGLSSCGISIYYDDTYSEEWDWDVNGRDISFIDAHTENGTITLVGTDRNEVTVHAMLEVRADSNYADAKDFARDVQVIVEQDGRELYIRKEHPREPHGIDISVSYEIETPSDVDIRLRTSNGQVEVSDIDGEVSVSTSNGNIELQDVRGRILASTSNGSIKLDDIVGRMDARTSNGRVEAFVRELEGESVFDTSNGAIDIEIVDGIAPVKATTSNGSIDIALPDNFSGQLDASTSTAKVHCDIPVYVSGKQKENELVGEIGRGGNATVMLRSSNGSIRIREARSYSHR